MLPNVASERAHNPHRIAALGDWTHVNLRLWVHHVLLVECKFFAPVIQPTLRAGVDAFSVAALTFLFEINKEFRISLRVGLVSGTSSFIYSIAGGDEAINFFQA